MISLEKCIAEIEFRFPGVASNPATSEEWQTLKTAVLGTTPNKQSTPCPNCEDFRYIGNKYCRDCGSKLQ